MKNTLLIGLAALALVGTGCNDFLAEYSQSQTVARNISHFDEVLLGDGYIPSSGLEFISLQNAGWLNVMDDDVTTSDYYSAGTKWAGLMKPLFGYYAWQFEVFRNPNGIEAYDDAQTWLSFYRRINVANIILNEMEELVPATEEETLARVRVQGECHFIRGQLYFTLANLYGKAYHPATADTCLAVPLKLSPYVEHDKEKETQFERATVAQVYAQVEADLLEAIRCLGLSGQARPLHRASKEAAQLLLSRVYLYMQQWDKAAAMAKSLVEARPGLYKMSARDTANTFLTESNLELLFSQGPLNIQNCVTGEGGDFAVSEELAALLADENDFRHYFIANNFETGHHMLTRKFKRGSKELVSHVSDIFTLRMAEAYLNLAEASALSGNEAEANLRLRTLREHRMKEYAHEELTGEALIDAIRLERRKELCFEGHRWFDLRRYAVCTARPFAKELRHPFNMYTEVLSTVWDRTDMYVLPADDPAWTFQLPKSVLEYDETPMPANPRNKRPALGEDE